MYARYDKQFGPKSGHAREGDLKSTDGEESVGMGNPRPSSAAAEPKVQSVDANLAAGYEPVVPQPAHTSAGP